MVWCADEAAPPAALREGDRPFIGNIVQAMQAYAKGHRGDVSVRLQDVDQIIAIGSDRMMAAVASPPARASGAVTEARSHCACQHQLTDAVHDEGDLRAVPGVAR